MPPRYEADPVSDYEKVTFEVTDQDPSETDVQSGTIVEQDGLKRGLKTRHITLISISSVVGAGTFYGFGYALQLSGPLGSLIGFSITGITFLLDSSVDSDADM